MTRQGRPVGLIIAAIAAIAIGLLVLLLAKSGEDGAAAGPTSGTPGSGGGGGGGGGAPNRPRPSLEATGAPEVVASNGTGQGSTGGEPGYTETVINGVRVRDHRKNRAAPFTVEPGGRPPDVQKIRPALSAEIADRIVPIVRECGAGVPREARGEKPRAEGEAVIAIRNKQVVVTKATMQLTNVTGPSVDPARQCLEQKMVGLTLPAGDEQDLESYTITLSYGLF